MDTGLDHERCYRAVASRDARFDGAFYTAVRTTGIYCRPSCPATTPKQRNVTFFRTPAAAQREGFRACRRCRPDAVPGSPEWNVRGDVVGRAMRLVADGAVERIGVSGVAAALGYSERHLNRLVTEELGVGLLAIARAQRAHTARLLLETTDLPASEIAWAAGFGSVRSFNDTVLAAYGLTPSLLRGSRPAEPSAPTMVSRSRNSGSNASLLEQAGVGAPVAGVVAPGAGVGAPVAGVAAAGVVAPGAGHAPIVVRLAAREPFEPDTMLRFLGMRAVPGVEAWDGHTYRRALGLPHGHATVACAPVAGGIQATLRLADLRDLAPAVARLRRLFDLDADPTAVGELLGRDPLLAPLVAARPGLRIACSVDPHEMVVRGIVGQQVSVAGARTVVGRLVAAHGEPLAIEDPELTGLFPTAAAMAQVDPATLAMPRSRAAALTGACRALADGDLVLDPGVDRTEADAALRRLPGIGPWTAAYIAMRGLGDPDVMLASDLGVRRAIAALGADDNPRAIEQRAHAWRPWRSYAVAHLWTSLSSPATPPAAPPTPHPQDSRRTR